MLGAGGIVPSGSQQHGLADERVGRRVRAYGLHRERLRWDVDGPNGILAVLQTQSSRMRVTAGSRYSTRHTSCTKGEACSATGETHGRSCGR